MNDRKIAARLRRWFGWSVAAVALLSLVVVGAIGWVGSERALHPAYHRYDWSLSAFPDLHPQQLTGKERRRHRAGRALLSK
jgi:hypothetical protein